MLWSLLKILVFVVVLVAAASGVHYLINADGGISLSIPQLGIEANPGALQSVIALIALVVIVWVLLKALSFLVALWRFMNGDDTAISRFFTRNREAKGYEALSQSLMALASGEGQLALAKAEKAQNKLDRPELTSLLIAQAAEMAGDRKKAEETYRKMVQNEKTRFVGVRGIMKQKLADGDTETAFKLAEKAFALKPKHVETQDTLLQLQAGREDWKGARNTLSAKLKHGALPRDVYKRRDAVLALSEAKAVLGQEMSIEAREAAIQANKLSPELVPAAAMAAQSYHEKGQNNWATKVLKKAWQAAPHPDLARAFAALEPDETPQARLQRFQVLTRMHPDDDETKMLLAELMIAAEDFPGAKRALGDVFDRDPTVRSATLMAAIEKGQGAEDSVVKAWLARAVTAPRGPQWVCDVCQHIQSEWTPICDNCGAFDTLTWRRPPETTLAMPGGADMLPLLLGTDGTGADTSNAVVTTADDVTEADPVIINGADTNEQPEARH